MARYIARRLLQLVPTLVAVSFLIFLMVRLIPGDPALLIAGENASPELVASIRERLGLDRPLLLQYGAYLGSLVRGDLGTSLRTHRPVAEEIAARLPATLQLAVASGLIFTVVGVLLGVTAGIRRGRWPDHLVRVLSLVGVSSPAFWIGILLMLAFSLQLRLLPSAGRGTLAHVVLPAVTASLVGIALVSRLVRASIIEILGEDYVRTARAKGLAHRAVVYRHVLFNALIPAVTILGLEFGVLLGGLVVVESVFAWPGSGKLLIDAIRMRDYPVVQSVVLLFAFMLAAVNLLVDLLCGVLDPRIRHE
jgi:peptide/nickel transport system permease protein/oligopeptide transport system permease protein